MEWRDITGEEPPPTPISARLYTEHGFPWFDFYDESKGDIEGSDVLGGVKTVKGSMTTRGSANSMTTARSTYFKVR